MVSPPPVSGRRALVAACWLAVTFAGLIGAVFALAWALEGGPPPSLQAVSETTHLEYPDSTEVVEADFSGAQAPAPGATSEVTVDIPEGDFGDFVAANGMAAPLVTGSTPAGAASGLVPAGCTDEVCYSGTIVMDGDVVTVKLRVTLL